MIKVWNTVANNKYGTQYYEIDVILSLVENGAPLPEGIKYDNSKRTVCIPSTLVDKESREPICKGTFIINVIVSEHEFEKRPMLDIRSFNFEVRK